MAKKPDKNKATGTIALNKRARHDYHIDESYEAGIALQLHQGLRVDRLDLRHDQMWLLLLDQRTQHRAIEHVQHVAAMRNLHRRCVCITSRRDYFHPETLQLQGDFLAQFARSQQQHPGRGGRKRSAKYGHGWAGR